MSFQLYVKKEFLKVNAIQDYSTLPLEMSSLLLELLTIWKRIIRTHSSIKRGQGKTGSPLISSPAT